MNSSSPPARSMLPQWTDRALHRLDDSQRKAATADPNVSLLIQAGAGSGKTQTMASRIAFLVASGVSPSAILGICFTRKAAEELRSRVALTMQSSPHALDAKTLKLRTLHAFGLECLRRYEKIDDSTDVYDLPRQHKLAEEVVTAHARVARDADAAERLVEYVNTAKTKKSLPPIEMNPANQEAYLFRFYQTMLHEERNAVDFGDLQQMFYELLKPLKAPSHARPSGSDKDTVLAGQTRGSGSAGGAPAPLTAPTLASPACASLRHRFTHIIVDEFQDLNEVQFEVVALMAGEHCRVTCVGDPNQCIYGWRGAMPHIFDQWKRRFPQTQQCVLGINYRSDPPIVSVANSVVRAVQAPFHARQNLDPVLLTCANQSDEYAAVPFMIEHFLRVRDPRLRYGDIAVLCRTRARAAHFVTALRDHGIPVVELKSDAGDGLSTVVSLLAYFRLCVNPHRDDDVREVLLNAPHRLSPRVARAFMVSLYATRDDLRRHDAWAAAGTPDRAMHGDVLPATAVRYSLYHVLRHLVHQGFSLDQFPLMAKVGKPTAAVLREFIAVIEGTQQRFDEFHNRVESRGTEPAMADLVDVVAQCIDFVTVKAHYDSGEDAVQFVRDGPDLAGASKKGARKRSRGQAPEARPGGEDDDDKKDEEANGRGRTKGCCSAGTALAETVARAFTSSSTTAAPREGVEDAVGETRTGPPAAPKTLRDLLQSALAAIGAEALAVEAHGLVPVKVEAKEEDDEAAAASTGAIARPSMTVDVDVIDVDAESDEDGERDAQVPLTSDLTATTPTVAPPRVSRVLQGFASLRRPEQLLLTVLDEFTALLPSDDFGPLQVPVVGSEATADGGGGMRAMAAVSIGTVHSAKGLEWPAVILPGCYVGHFPLNNEEEERRVFYVAMSRAETQLLLVTAQRHEVQADPRSLTSKTKEEALLPTPYIMDIIKMKGMVDATYADIIPKSEPVGAQPAPEEEDAEDGESLSRRGACGGVQAFAYAELKRGHHQRQLEM